MNIGHAAHDEEGDLLARDSVSFTRPRKGGTNEIHTKMQCPAKERDLANIQKVFPFSCMHYCAIRNCAYRGRKIHALGSMSTYRLCARNTYTPNASKPRKRLTVAPHQMIGVPIR